MNLPEIAVFATLELSKSAWLLAAQAVPSGRASAHRLSGGAVEGLLALLRRLQDREQRSSGQEVAIILGDEAGYDGFWLQRRLATEAITCFVMDPGSLQVDRRARRAKTGRLDAAMLLRALMAWCRGDLAACRVVQVPSVEREDARRTHRERQRLIAERVQHVNRVKGLLTTQGIYTFQPLRHDRWERLKEVRTGDGRDLPRRLRGEIERKFRQLELLLEQVAAAEAERDAAVADPVVADADAEKVARLARPELFRLLADARPGGILLVEQVDRLSRLTQPDWERLKSELGSRCVRVVALDLPTSWVMATAQADAFTARLFEAVNGMMLDVLAAVACKDYDDRRRRQAQGQARAKAVGRYKGRPEDVRRNAGIASMLKAGLPWSAIRAATGASRTTIAKVAKCGAPTIACENEAGPRSRPTA